MGSLTWIIFDIMGTVAFAISGAMVGIERKMDVFGITVLALATAVGGGMVRDVLVGITPPVALCNVRDFLLAVVTAVVVSVVYVRFTVPDRHKKKLLAAYNLCDTVGLAAFTVTGMLTGITWNSGDPYVLPVLLGTITAVGGGMIRDVLASRVPAVLYKDFYATAALLGAIITCPLYRHLGISEVSWLCFFLVIGLRYGALRFGWQLFHPHGARRV